MTGGSRKSWAASRDFIMIHLDLLDAVDGSYPAAAVWSRILYRAGADGWWTASRDDMLRETRLTERVLRRALQELREAGLVEHERVSPFDPTLRWRITWESEAGDPGGGGPIDHPVMDDSSITVTDDLSITSSQKVRNTPLPPEGEQGALFGSAAAAPPPPPDPDPLRGFDAWYDLYPRKVAKGDARKAWTQVLRGGADPEVIRLGLLAQIETLRDQQARGFCPYPASWLRAERWADAPDNVRTLRPAVPSPGEAYDPAAAAALPPPPRKDLFG